MKSDAVAEVPVAEAEHDEAPVLETSLREELKVASNGFEIPEALKQRELQIYHEAGHATIALALGVPITAYYFRTGTSWHEDGTEPIGSRHRRIAAVRPDPRGANYSSEAIRLIAVGGAAAELSKFNHIETAARDLNADKVYGGLQAFGDIQVLADEVADRFDGDLRPLYHLVLGRICSGRGFEDINSFIRSGKSPLDLLK